MSESPKSFSPFLKIGLTGGIGSGKSTVSQIIRNAGFMVIDADAIAHELTQKNGGAMPAICLQFGDEMKNNDGGLNREAMRKLIFEKPKARQELQELLHPLIGRRIHEDCLLAEQKGEPCVWLDIPLLVESHYWAFVLDKVVVVDCLPQTQIDRVIKRNGLSVETIQSIMAAQASREDRLAAADIIIFNDGINLLELKKTISDIFEKLNLNKHSKNEMPTN